MKKLLTILGTIALVGTTSASVIACGEGETPTPPAPNTNISTKITSPINLGQLDTNTKVNFLAKLQTKLILMPNLTTITTNDYDIFIAGTATAIQDSDIIKGTSLNIKIVAKGNKFEGEKDNIIVNYIQHMIIKTDISTIITKLTIINSIIVDINNNNQELDTEIKNTFNEDEDELQIIKKPLYFTLMNVNYLQLLK